VREHLGWSLYRLRFFLNRVRVFLREPSLRTLPGFWWLYELVDSPKSFLWERTKPYGRRPRIHRILYALREIMDSPLSVSPRASTDTMLRAASVVAVVRLGFLTEAGSPAQTRSFAKLVEDFTPEQWREIEHNAGEALAWYEHNKEQERRRQERLSQVAG
jgi:hypothetical protein